MQYQILEGCDAPALPMSPATDMQVINLLNFPLEERHIKLLSRGLSFSSSTSMDEFIVYKDIRLFLRKVIFHIWHGGHKDSTQTGGSLPETPEDKEERSALENLVALLEEKIGIEDEPNPDRIRRPSGLYIKSIKMPPFTSITG